MTTSTNARRRPAAGPNPEEQQPVNDRDIHHLFDLIRDDHIRFTNYQHTDLTGASVDDLVYAAEAKGLVTVHPDGVIKPTEKGRQWRGHNHRPARVPAVVFQPAEVV